jgi:Bacterial SH3 domain
MKFARMAVTAAAVLVLAGYQAWAQSAPDQSGPPQATSDQLGPPGPPPPGGPQGGPPPGGPQGGPPPPAAVNTAVNLRQGPGTNYTVITTIPAGAPVEVSGCSGAWCQVSFQGQNGYIIGSSLGPGGPGGPPPAYAGGPPPPGYYPPGYVPPPPYYGPYYYGYGPYYHRPYYGGYWHRHW